MSSIPQPFEVRTERIDDTTVVTPIGELDLATVDRLEADLDPLDNAPGAVILDLRQVSFIDSMGLSLVLRTRERLEAAGIDFAIAEDGGQVRRLLQLSGVAEVLKRATPPS